MNTVHLEEHDIHVNTAIVKEEQNGTAAELAQIKTTSVSEPVLSTGQRLSVLEVIA